MATRVNTSATAANKKHARHKTLDAREFKLMSILLNHQGEISKRNTAEGEGLSPAFNWSGAPAEAEELVLLCEDLDSETEEHKVHWLVYRIPVSVRELPEGIPEGQQVKSVVGTPLQGRNSNGSLGYLPPSLTPFDDWHHYRFRLFALDTSLKNLQPGMSKQELEKLMKPHILEAAELVGRYRRSNFKGITPSYHEFRH